MARKQPNRTEKKTFRSKEPRHAKRAKVYEGLERVPHGDAIMRITDGCLALEGGAFRGLYTSGVLDVMMQAGLNLQTTIGVSAGALNALGYVAGQIGFSATINLKYRHDPRYVGVEPMANPEDRGVIGFDYLFGEIIKNEPINIQRLMRPERRMIAVATALTTAMPVFFEKKEDCQVLFKAVQASASMPYITKPVEVMGIRCLDGGCSMHIPHPWALQQGFDKIVVVRTRPRSYRKKTGNANRRLAEMMYPTFPEFVEALSTMNEEYNAQCDELDRLEAEGRVFVIAPRLPITISRLEGDMNRLGEVYWMGVADMRSRLEALKEYLQ